MKFTYEKWFKHTFIRTNFNNVNITERWKILVTEKEKELILQFRGRTKYYIRMFNFLFQDLGFNAEKRFNLDSYSDEFIMQAINLLNTDIKHYENLKTSDMKKLDSINNLYCNIDDNLLKIREKYKDARQKLIEIRNNINNYQELFPEIRSPLANISTQPKKKIEFSDEDLVYLTNKNDLENVDWSVEIRRIQERKEKMKKNEYFG